ncbi:MAG: helix-turn-helix domain-containing protein [Kiritimatiellae bacterium]|nr:helix-turn-helix domain-containing protein [Kiritimatiellia bacterium]
MRNADQPPLISVYPPEPRGLFPFRLLGTGIVQARGHEVIQRRGYDRCTTELVLAGEGHVEVNGFSCRVRAGDVYILQKGSDHLYCPERRNPYRKIFFVVDGLLMEQIFSAYGLTSVYHVPPCGVQPLFEAMHSLHKQRGAQVHRRAALIFHQIVAQFHERLIGEGMGYPPDVLLMKQYLDEHVEAVVRLRDLCRLVGKSEAHIIRTFKRTVGKTPYEYLLARRLALAELMLTDTPLSVKAIAERLAFTDEYYFSNFFRQRSGRSPRAYRRHSRGLGATR